VLVGAGDIASCGSQGDEATARLLDAIPGTVFTAGDNAYELGTHQEFINCYHPTWGRHRARTRPTIHDHHYERFAPLDASGRLDRVRGIRQFVVGTGGRSHYPVRRSTPQSEVRNTGTFGVLKLTLAADGYTWEFIAENGKTFTDSGTAVCH